jgi:hypothetical protein
VRCPSPSRVIRSGRGCYSGAGAGPLAERATAAAQTMPRPPRFRLSARRAVHRTPWSECDFARVRAQGWSELLAHVWSCAIGDRLAARTSFQRKIRAAPERVDSQAGSNLRTHANAQLELRSAEGRRHLASGSCRQCELRSTSLGAGTACELEPFAFAGANRAPASPAKTPSPCGRLSA